MAQRRVVVLVVIVVACLAACTRDKPAGAELVRDTATATDVSVTTGTWPAELGDMLIVPSDTDNLAVVLYPVSADLRGAPAALVLISSGGDTLRRGVGLGARDSMHCGDATVARLTRVTPPLWSLGIHSSTATPLASDSADALSPEESTAFTTESARLASSVATVQTSRFAGLPFTLSTLRRFRVSGREVVVAQVVRRVNSEADPREERTLIVAERPVGDHGRFTLVHSARSEGSEDATDHFDMLSALKTAHGALVVIARETSMGTTFEILERDASGAWAVTWSRSVAC